VPIYLKFGPIEGAVTASGLEGWIELGSLVWGVTNPESTTGKGGSGRESVSDITIGKAVDRASVQLLKRVVTGEPTSGVMIKFYKSINHTEIEYLRYVLENTLVTSYSFDAFGESTSANSPLPTESLSLNFHKVDIQYAGQPVLDITVPPGS
jgi:type VI secretion system secreted protein Hcp